MTTHLVRIHSHRSQDQAYWRGGALVALRNVGVVCDRPWGDLEIDRALVALASGKVIDFRVPTPSHYHIVRCYLEHAGFVVDQPRPEVYDLR